MSESVAKEKNVNHRDIVGDIHSKTKGTTVGELYAEDGGHCCPIEKYHEKLKYSQWLKGYIPCWSEEGQEGDVRILGTAWGKVLAPILAALLILTGAIVAIWYFTRESGPPLDESAIAYQMPNRLKNEDPNQIMLPGFKTLTMDAQTGKVEAAQSFEQDLAGTIQMEDITLTVNATGTQNDVKPPEPYGYYNYYEEYEGYQYYVASVTVKNSGDAPFDPTSCKITAAMSDQSTADGKLVLLNEIDSDFKESLDVGRKCNGYLFILGKEEVGIPETINIYYNREFKVKEETEQYDMQIILHVVS